MTKIIDWFDDDPRWNEEPYKWLRDENLSPAERAKLIDNLLDRRFRGLRLKVKEASIVLDLIQKELFKLTTCTIKLDEVLRDD